jgi:hypothetical protein
MVIVEMTGTCMEGIMLHEKEYYRIFSKVFLLPPPIMEIMLLIRFEEIFI